MRHLVTRVVHLLHSLEYGGKERIVLQLAQHGRAGGDDHQLVLFDQPFRGAGIDLDPEQVPWHFVRRGGGLDLAFVWRLRRLLRRLAPDALHAHNDTAMVYAALAARAYGLRKLRAVTTWHARPTYITERSRAVTRFCSRWIDAPVAVSTELQQLLLQQRWLRRCDLLENGVETERFRPGKDAGGWRQRLGVPDDAFLVAHIGRFHPCKRQQDLHAAVQRLAGSAHAVFVGQGETLAAFRAATAAAPAVHVVPATGAVADLLRAADAFVLCSDDEAMPMALLEAMATALPVVVTRIGAMPEMVSGGALPPAGIVVPVGDTAALAQELERLRRDPALRAQFGAAGRARVERGHAFSATWQQYRRLYAPQ
ncbi:MAG TPA: glycosyltransferase family 4 protein [Planctomycetota bacterium]|nr:glycosyltransferase family 4 protein [Planctomycetota bacterium]